MKTLEQFVSESTNQLEDVVFISKRIQDDLYDMRRAIFDNTVTLDGLEGFEQETKSLRAMWKNTKVLHDKFDKFITKLEKKVKV